MARRTSFDPTTGMMTDPCAELCGVAGGGSYTSAPQVAACLGKCDLATGNWPLDAPTALDLCRGACPSGGLIEAQFNTGCVQGCTFAQAVRSAAIVQGWRAAVNPQPS